MKARKDFSSQSSFFIRMHNQMRAQFQDIISNQSLKDPKALTK